MDVSPDISYEPMEVDQSSNSSGVLSTSPVKSKPNQDTVEFQIRDLNETHNKEIDSKGKISVKVQDLNKTSIKIDSKENSSVQVYHIKLERKEKNWKLTKILISAIVLILSIALYFIVNIKCSETLDLIQLKNTLTNNLFGQTEAINSMIEILNVTALTKIMLLCGGTGVGKTYTISLMMEKLQNASNVYHYTMPGFATTFSPDLLLGMTLCKDSILIVDDLTPKDLNINQTIKQVIEKSENLKKNLTVILVFNCDEVSENFYKKCDSVFYDDLQQSFKGMIAVQKVIRFQQLTNEHLKNCIERELGEKDVNEYRMSNLMKHFNVSLDGCKGVYTKVKFLNAV